MIRVEVQNHPLHDVKAFFQRPFPLLLLRGAAITALAVAAIGLLTAAVVACPPISSVIVYVTLTIGIRIALVGITFFAFAGYGIAIEDYEKQRGAQKV